MVPAFGMTETVIHATTAAPYQHIPPGSMGTPTPGYEMLVVDSLTDEVLTDGRVGELLVRGTRGIQMFLEYYGNPEATAESFTADGFFKTGDRVRIGAGGAIFYSERDKDMLKVGGENVSAKEIEDLCRQVPGVRDVAVVGRSHPTLDEVPVAFVVKGPDAAAGLALERQIVEIAQQNLADFKVPRAVYYVDDFPRATLDKSRRTRCVNRPTAFPSHSEVVLAPPSSLPSAVSSWSSVGPGASQKMHFVPVAIMGSGLALDSAPVVVAEIRQSIRVSSSMRSGGRSRQ